jgi:hypothetical protein
MRALFQEGFDSQAKSFIHGSVLGVRLVWRVWRMRRVRKRKPRLWKSGAFYEEAGGAGWGTAGFLSIGDEEGSTDNCSASVPIRPPRRWKLGSLER